MSYEQVNVEHFTGLKVLPAVRYYLKFQTLTAKISKLEQEVTDLEYALYCNPVEILKDASEELASHMNDLPKEELKDLTRNCVNEIAKRRKKNRPDAMMKHLVGFYLIPDFELLEENVVDPEDVKEHKEQSKTLKKLKVDLEQAREELPKLKENAHKAYWNVPPQYQKSGPHVGILAFIQEWKGRVRYYKEPVTVGAVSIGTIRTRNEEMWKEWKEAYEKLKLGDEPKNKHVYQARDFSSR